MDDKQTTLSKFTRWALVAMSGLLGGCADAPSIPLAVVGRLPPVEHIQDKLDALNLSVLSPKPGANVDTARWVACMAPLSSRLKPGLIQWLNSAKADNELAEIGILGELEDGKLLSDHPLIAELLDRLTVAPRWSGPFELAGKIKADLGRHLQADNQQLRADTQQALRFSKTYLKAYFKKGAAVAASRWLQNPEETRKLQQQAAGFLKLKADDPELGEALGLFYKRLHQLADQRAGFVGRDGSQFGFPGIVEHNSRIDIDHSQVAADTLRVVLEALRDSIAPLPVLPQATAALSLKDYVVDFDKPLHWIYDRRDGAFADITIDEARFQEIEAHARMAEASVAGAVGKAIRGGSWGALNNEAVAKLVETAAGVLSRHMTERADWCLQAQAGD